jgi:hypothetical protein
VFSLSLSTWAIYEVSISRARCHSCSSSGRFHKSFLFSIFRSNSVIEFETQIAIKFNFQSILFVIFLYVMYYASLLQKWHPIMILVRTNHPCLRVERHSWYQSITGVIHHVWSYLQKSTMRICLDAHIRTIVVLTGGKLTEIYFLYLFYTIYYSVMTHLRQAKKIILPPGDLNPKPIPSKWGLVEYSLHRAVWVACLSCDWPQPRT